MKHEKPPKNLEELLDRMGEAIEESGEVSLESIMDEVGRKSFSPLLLAAGLLIMMPVLGDIPGVPTITGVYILLIAGQLLWGRNYFWLPKWLLNRSVAADKLKKASRSKWIRRPARAIDHVLRRRLGIFTGPAGARAIAVVSILLALATPASEFVPLSANGIGLAVTAFGLSLIAHDGAVALIGFLFTAGTVALAFQML